ncbi:hypothetical protein GJ744_005101 [Endocarpon pusillum]|uniref:Uncharacterized protein n=1 Tax=Endocarpon pusillum TaxID=364733 RepID=A0A8H7APM2_9EURO|nr:hypothetical protein GJ744_005101 [Endocarpon pusillum]
MPKRSSQRGSKQPELRPRTEYRSCCSTHMSKMQTRHAACWSRTYPTAATPPDERYNSPSSAGFSVTQWLLVQAAKVPPITCKPTPTLSPTCIPQPSTFPVGEQNRLPES